MIAIQVNGEPHEVAVGTTVSQLLKKLGFGDKPVAVECNQEVVPRAKHPSVELKSNDSLELVSFVGGG